MKRFGLIGNPISHSLSPALFKAAYPDAGMTYDLIQAASFDEAMSRFEEGYDAVNVTAPFKEKAFLRAESADPITRQIGATNLLVRKGSVISAFNTDFWGVSNILRLHSHDFDSPKVLVAGCGGAGKAAALAASDLHMDVTVANRDFDKAAAFCKAAGGIAPAPLNGLEELVLENDIIIYTIPAGADLAGNLPLAGKLVIEANYRDPSLKEMSESSGAVYVPGQEWLLAQGIVGFGLMTGLAPDEKSMRDLLL